MDYSEQVAKTEADHLDEECDCGPQRVSMTGEEVAWWQWMRPGLRQTGQYLN